MYAVVFDMDGVLFDSERFYIECWKIVAEKYGIEGIEEACYECIGTNATETRRKMLERYGADFPYDSYVKEVSALFRQGVEEGRLPKKAGAGEILRYLKERGVKLALASSTKTASVRAELADAGLLSYFTVVIGGDMVEKSKPEPDIFLRTCEELQADPKETYVIEDSYNGVRAAYAAGMKAVMVPDILPPTPEMEEKTERIFPDLYAVTDFFQTIT